MYESQGRPRTGSNKRPIVEQLAQDMLLGSVWKLALVECPVPVTMDLVWMIMTHCYCVVYILLFYVRFQCSTRGQSLSYGGE